MSFNLFTTTSVTLNWPSCSTSSNTQIQKNTNTIVYKHKNIQTHLFKTTPVTLNCLSYHINHLPPFPPCLKPRCTAILLSGKDKTINRKEKQKVASKQIRKFCRGENTGFAAAGCKSSLALSGVWRPALAPTRSALSYFVFVYSSTMYLCICVFLYLCIYVGCGTRYASTEHPLSASLLCQILARWFCWTRPCCWTDPG